MKATALEILSEPLTLLILLVALALAVLAPVLHYHQFGESTRMARDAGLSAIFTCGCTLAIFGTIRAFRREIESGTLEMALAHPISRGQFFFAKTVGALLALFVFVLTVFGVLSTMVAGAAVGGRIAEETGSLARVWGPAVVAGAAVSILPLVLGALLNRFVRCRFAWTTLLASFVLSLGAMTVFGCLVGWGDTLRLANVTVLLIVFEAMLLAASAAFAMRFATNIAVSFSVLVLVALLPLAGNYYLAEMLANGGRITAVYMAFAVLAALPALAALLIMGVKWTKERT